MVSLGVSVSALHDAAGGCLEVQTDLDQVNILAVILWNIETTADDMAVCNNLSVSEYRGKRRIVKC